MKKYCVVCDWAVSTVEGYSRTECSSRALDHFLETGHGVESEGSITPTQNSTSEPATTWSTAAIQGEIQDRTGFDPITDTYHLQYDWTDRLPLDLIIRRAVAAITGEILRERALLSETLDPAALNALFCPTGTGGLRSAGQVSFLFDDHEVTIHADGDIVLRPPDSLITDEGKDSPHSPFQRSTRSPPIGCEEEWKPRERSEADTHRTQHDWSSSRSLTTTVVSLFETVTGQDQAELDPLHRVVDPEALDALFRPTDDTRRVDGEVAFTLNECHVVVHANGIILMETSEISGNQTIIADT